MRPFFILSLGGAGYGLDRMGLNRRGGGERGYRARGLTLAVVAMAPVVLFAGACAEPQADGAGPTPPTSSRTSAATAVASASAAPREGLAPLDGGMRAAGRVLLRRAEAQSDRRVRVRMAASILRELEANRLPARVLAALAAASERRVEVAKRAVVVWDAIAETPPMLEAWDRACRAGPGDDGGKIVALVAAKEATARERSATIFGLCELERVRLVSVGELSLDYDLVVLAHAVREYLMSKTSLAPEEEQAIALLALGGVLPERPIVASELPRPIAPRLLPSGEQAELKVRLRKGIKLLHAGATAAFFREIVHPDELGGLRLDEAAQSFAGSGKSALLREALEIGVERAVVDDGDGEASIRMPWRPGRDMRERLRFQRQGGRWYLRL